ncbi:MAG: helix-turn-helix transcriptional regulator [Clostridia bacterium]|nr:helix-turn-helix transcriptional regulator [Clostridia bacterium]
MLSDNLKKFRRKCGFTQLDVAKALGLERSTYSYYESGKTCPDLNTLAKLVRIFNTTYNELLEDDEMKRQILKLTDSSDEFFDMDIRSSNQLLKEEKLLISYFRLLPSEEKINVINDVNKKLNDIYLKYI